MARKKRLEARDLAVFIAVYGIAPRPLTEEDFVGLYLNIGMVEHRKAYAAYVSHSIGNSSAPLAREFFRAATETQAEADDLEFDVNSARKRSELGW